MLGNAEDPRGRAKAGRRRAVARCLAAAGAAILPRPGREAPPHQGLVDVGQIEAASRRAGLVVHAGERLVLVTDRPPREGDGVPGLPGVFDEAFAAWCAHYG
ncbi:MAG: hypothetical protein ACKO5R_06225, partial [Planctomycetaceae bacterium]